MKVNSAPVASLTNPGWYEGAACKSLPKSLFFSNGATGEAAEDILAAKRVCGGCGVRLTCLAFSLVTEQQYGVWGGTSEDERLSLRRLYRRSGLDEAVRAAGERPGETMPQ